MSQTISSDVKYMCNHQCGPRKSQTSALGFLFKMKRKWHNYRKVHKQPFRNVFKRLKGGIIIPELRKHTSDGWGRETAGCQQTCCVCVCVCLLPSGCKWLTAIQMQSLHPTNVDSQKIFTVFKLKHGHTQTHTQTLKHTRTHTCTHTCTNTWKHTQKVFNRKVFVWRPLRLRHHLPPDSFTLNTQLS